MTLQLGSLTEILGWTLLHFVWQGTLAALALGGILSVLPRRWANPRYLLACVTLAAMALLPLATGLTLAQQSAAALELAWAAPGISVPTPRPESGQLDVPASVGTSVWQDDASAVVTRVSATAAPLTRWFPWLSHAGLPASARAPFGWPAGGGRRGG